MTVRRIAMPIVAITIATAVSFGLASCTASTALHHQPQHLATVASPSNPPASASASPPASTGPRDGGARKGAEGVAHTNSAGIVVSYTVAKGDTAGVICERFSVNPSILENDKGQPLPNYWLITPGEVIKFHPFTNP